MKNLNPVERLAMASKLTLEGKATPVRRIWIPKPGKDEKRPLGIPTMMDRARQALAKMALEPEWEAVFEPNSYGFRPGRSCHDAIEQIHTAMRKEKYILEADIKGCFDSIDTRAGARCCASGSMMGGCYVLSGSGCGLECWNKAR